MNAVEALSYSLDSRGDTLKAEAAIRGLHKRGYVILRAAQVASAIENRSGLIPADTIRQLADMLEDESGVERGAWDIRPEYRDGIKAAIETLRTQASLHERLIARADR